MLFKAAFSAELPEFPDISLIADDAILGHFWEWLLFHGKKLFVLSHSVLVF